MRGASAGQMTPAATRPEHGGGIPKPACPVPANGTQTWAGGLAQSRQEMDRGMRNDRMWHLVKW